jgi:hypothetical protein
LNAKLSKLLEASSGDDWSSNYRRKELQTFRHDLILKLDGKKAADAYIKEHLDNAHFRKIAIEKAISRREYSEALKLCKDGEKADEKYAGTLSGWKHLRYGIYEKTGDVAGQKELARELTLDGDFDFFTKLKKLYASDEWQSVLQALLPKLNSRTHYGGIYLKVLIHEKLKAQTLEYCKKYPHSLIDLYPHLLPEYKADLDGMFTKSIMDSASYAANRKAYAGVCDIIRHYAKACGHEGARTIRRKLLEKHCRQPAFVDELKKI